MNKTMTIEAPEGYEIDKDKSTFEKIVFKEKSGLPMSWEDFIANYYPKRGSMTGAEIGETFDFVWGNVPLEYKALRKLELLRDAWNGDWKADWTDNPYKYTINHRGGDVLTDRCMWTSVFLHFKTAELRDLFAKTFKDLIEEAKPLL